MAINSNNNPDVILQSLFRSNHQLGITTRFASAISRVKDTESLTRLTEAALIDFGMSGLFQIVEPSNKYLKRFGNAIDRSVFERLVCMQKCGDKICARDNFIIFCLTHFTLILDAADLKEEQIDETKDNLAIFCDIIDAWINQYVQVQQQLEELAVYKNQILENISLLTQNVGNTSHTIKTQHAEIAQSLLHKLATRFPTLGLEPDQEDEILNNIETTIEMYGKLIKDQVLSNHQLIALLSEAAEFLQGEDSDVVNNPVTTIPRPNEHITLFN